MPSSVDWRSEYDIPIRDQGSCGSCWAFSATYEVEIFNYIVNGRQSNLSEQDLVDCVYDHDDCLTGGWMWDAYTYISKMGGVPTESDYPYTSGETGTVSNYLLNL